MHWLFIKVGDLKTQIRPLEINSNLRAWKLRAPLRSYKMITFREYYAWVWVLKVWVFKGLSFQDTLLV